MGGFERKNHTIYGKVQDSAPDDSVTLSLTITIDAPQGMLLRPRGVLQADAEDREIERRKSTRRLLSKSGTAQSGHQPQGNHSVCRRSLHTPRHMGQGSRRTGHVNDLSRPLRSLDASSRILLTAA